MSDWNEQAAPNNNLSSINISKSKLVGKNATPSKEVTDDPSAGEKGMAELSTHLKSHQPGM